MTSINPRNKHVVSVHVSEKPVEGDLLWSRALDASPDHNLSAGMKVWVVFFKELPDFRLPMYLSEMGDVVYLEYLRLPSEKTLVTA